MKAKAAQPTQKSSRPRKRPLTALAKRRHELGLSQAEAAQRAHLATRTYAKIEAGQTSGLTLRSLIAVTRAFDVPLAELTPQPQPVKMTSRRTRDAANQPAPAVALRHGIVQQVDLDERVVRVAFDGGARDEDVWLIPLYNVPEPSRREGACLALRVQTFAPGDVRATLEPEAPTRTPEQRALLDELARLHHRR